MTYLQDIAQEMEKFTNVTAMSSEKHVEMRPTRIQRDTHGVQKLQEWFSNHPPFPEADVIMSISSEIVGSDQVNCHKAQQSRDGRSIKASRNLKKTYKSTSYELVPFPMYLFNEDGMCQGTKSALYAAFTHLPIDFELSENHIVVIDVPRVLNGQEGVRLTPHEKFLSNENNKTLFVTLLRIDHEASNIITKQAEEDADVLIVTTAESLASEYETVLIVGEDIDLLDVIAGTSPETNNVYLRKPGRCNSPNVFYSSSSFNYDSAENVLLLHAISGCDTTSNVFGFGKNKFCNLFQRNPLLLKIAQEFTGPDTTTADVSEAGERILVVLYGGDHE
ncbi:hypothetical protein PR048_032183 [Dryococelus australis]|uniref:Uncharacterized protein n=1 Tax=Dryococelus australis TaxID=614101 RepID=A0ABQ9G1I2_9NEOP|nr:hypothetical protein PR048_032183 [Dryococelus australis]